MCHGIGEPRRYRGAVRKRKPLGSLGRIYLVAENLRSSVCSTGWRFQLRSETGDVAVGAHGGEQLVRPGELATVR